MMLRFPGESFHVQRKSCSCPTTLPSQAGTCTVGRGKLQCPTESAQSLSGYAVRDVGLHETPLAGRYHCAHKRTLTFKSRT